MDLGWVGMTQVGSEEVRNPRWTPRKRSSGTTGGTSGSTLMSQVQSRIGSVLIQGGLCEDERPSKNYPQQLTSQRQKSFESHLSSTLMRVKLVSPLMPYRPDDLDRDK